MAPVLRLPRRSRAIAADGAYWLLLCGIAVALEVVLSHKMDLAAVTMVFGGVSVVAGIHAFQIALAEFPSATRREWREQVALAGISERAWWHSTIGSAWRRLLLPAVLAQSTLAAMIWLEKPSAREDALEFLLFAVLLPVTGCLVSALGTAMAFRGMCRGRTSALARTLPWMAAGALLPCGVLAAILFSPFGPDGLMHALAALFPTAAVAVAIAWRRGWRGILAFE